MKNPIKNQKEVENFVSPSKVITNSFGSFFKKFALGVVYEIATDRYGDRPYAVRKKPQYEFFSILSYFLQILSIVFALAFSIHLLSGLMPNFLGNYTLLVSGVIGFCILFCLELAKKYVTTDFIDSYLKNKAVLAGYKLDYASGVLVLILVAFSVYSSTKGSEYFVELQSNKSVEITNLGNLKQDSLASVYAGEIKTVRNEIAEIKHRNSYKGHTYIVGSDKKLLLAKEQLLSKLINDKDKSLQGLTSAVQTEIQTNKLDTSDKAKKMFFASAINEILILLCFWATSNFLFKAKLELDNLGSQEQSNTSYEQTETNQEQKPIGFSVATASQKRTINGRRGGLVFAKQSVKTVNPIGFRIPQTKPNNGERITVNVPNGECKDGERICLHCSTKFNYKHWNAKYCGEQCRIEAWEQRTGKTLKKGKKTK